MKLEIAVAGAVAKVVTLTLIAGWASIVTVSDASVPHLPCMGLCMLSGTIFVQQRGPNLTRLSAGGAPRTSPDCPGIF